jgi:hydroxylamine reductase
MEDKKMITKEMVLGQIISENPKAAEVLMGCGMHCLGCPSSQMESLEDACMVHGLSVDEVLAKLNN